MSKMYLQNSRLKVEILKPGEVYKQTRFDWMGMITQISMDGKETFCVPESLIAGIGTNGRGLFNEFGIEEPIGYEEAKVGEKFPKLGVGLLTKFEDEPYKFNVDYEIEPFHCSIVKAEDNIKFSLTTKECRGYKVKQSKNISIKDNKLVINYCIENIGEKAILTTEYSHNFMGINNRLIGPEYILRFSEGFEIGILQQNLRVNSKEITWNNVVDKEFYFKLKNSSKVKGEYWELIHLPSAIGVRETLDFEIHRFAVWGNAHVISLEGFIKLDIKPGEKKEWSREFKFFNI